MMESTYNSQTTALSALHMLGTYIMLKKTSEMIKYGMVNVSYIDGKIIVTTESHVEQEHFLDAIESMKYFKSIDQKFTAVSNLDDYYMQRILPAIQSLVRRWDTGNGYMIGYQTTPEIDKYFLDIAIDKIIEWRNAAGIHYSAKFGNITGSELIEVGTILVSIALNIYILFMSVSRNYPTLII